MMNASDQIELTDNTRPRPPSIAETEDLSVAQGEPVSSMDIEQSMPTLAELRGKSDNEELEQRHRRGKLVMYTCIVAPFLLIAMIVIAVVASQTRSQNDPNLLKNMDQSDSFAAVTQYLSSNGISKSSELTKVGTPQNKAATFLAHNDQHPRKIPEGPPSTNKDGYDFVTRYVLAMIYYQMNGADWKYDLNFMEARETCDWQSLIITATWQTPMGALCNDDKMIEQIVMIGVNVKGTFPTELGHLSTLKILEMDVNEIQGSLPKEFQNMQSLANLHLSHNQLTGSLPSYLGNLQNLISIDVSFNTMDGSLPTAIADLPNLRGMALDNNLFTGQVPYWDASRLTDGKIQESLQYLFLEHNSFQGTLLQSAFQATPNIKVLDISDNEFTGSFPVSAFQLSTLEVLDVHDNDFTGEIPTNILPNEALLYLTLHNNRFTGQLKDSISNIRFLKHLDVSRNQLTGIELNPNSDNAGLPALHDLRYLYLADNPFNAGEIPNYLRYMTDLEELSLKSLNLDGTIPTWLGELENLVLLDLDNNELRGSIPSELGQLSQLQFLLLNRNELTDQVPTELGSLPYLRLLYLDTNALIGDATPICTGQRAPGVPTPIMVADCAGDDPELKCACCFKCCEVGGECNSDDIVPSNDPMWQFGYDRVFYSFGNLTGYFIAVDTPPP